MTARPYQLLSYSQEHRCPSVPCLHPGDAAASDAVDPAVLELEIQEQVKAAVAVVAEMQLVVEQLKVRFCLGCASVRATHISRNQATHGAFLLFSGPIERL